jgi:mitofusin
MCWRLGGACHQAQPRLLVRGPMVDIETLQGDPDAEVSPDYALKLYVSDPRFHGACLLNNGIADITLIDAPGLNSDSVKTTSLFARQEEIEVVVFCLSAENHFTLSAQELLTSASKEKATSLSSSTDMTRSGTRLVASAVA